MSDKRELLNSSLLDYRMMTSLDLPMIDTVIVEIGNPGHPFGIRGVGEASIVPPMGAVANAIHHAIGIEVDGLPLNPAYCRGLWRANRKTWLAVLIPAHPERREPDSGWRINPGGQGVVLYSSPVQDPIS